MRVDWLPPTDARWRDVLDVTRHDVYHLPAYGRLCARAEGSEAGALLIEDGDALLWPLLDRAVAETDVHDVGSPYGYSAPLCTASSAERAANLLRAGLPAAAELLRSRRCVSLFSTLHPLLAVHVATLSEFGTLVDHGSTVSINLRLPLETSWNQMRYNHRSQIRRATNRGCVAYYDAGLKHLPDFVRIYHATMRRIGADDFYMFPMSYFLDLREALGTRLHLWLAERDGVIGGGCLCTEECGIVQYHLSGTELEHRNWQPAKILIDAVRRWAYARGDLDLHLGGGVGGSESDSLFAFKAGFSPRRHPFRTFRWILDPDVYTALCARSQPKRAAGNETGFFPAYRQR
jgi:hypothetical protein